MHNARHRDKPQRPEASQFIEPAGSVEKRLASGTGLYCRLLTALAALLRWCSISRTRSCSSGESVRSEAVESGGAGAKVVTPDGGIVTSTPAGLPVDAAP